MIEFQDYDGDDISGEVDGDGLYALDCHDRLTLPFARLTRGMARELAADLIAFADSSQQQETENEG